MLADTWEPTKEQPNVKKDLRSCVCGMMIVIVLISVAVSLAFVNASNPSPIVSGLAVGACVGAIVGLLIAVVRVARIAQVFPVLAILLLFVSSQSFAQAPAADPVREAIYRELIATQQRSIENGAQAQALKAQVDALTKRLADAEAKLKATERPADAPKP